MGWNQHVASLSLSLIYPVSSYDFRAESNSKKGLHTPTKHGQPRHADPTDRPPQRAQHLIKNDDELQ